MVTIKTRVQKPDGYSNHPQVRFGVEATLRAMPEQRRGNFSVARHKRVVLSLIFLQYISDALEERHAPYPVWLERQKAK